MPDGSAWSNRLALPGPRPRRVLGPIAIAAVWLVLAGVAGAEDVHISYKLSGAEETVLVWGVDGWQLPPASMRPPGSEVRDNNVHTPMQSADGRWNATLTIPLGTVLDYGFLTTVRTGEACNIWESGQFRDLRLEVRADTSLAHVTPPYHKDDAGKLVATRGVRYWFPAITEVSLAWRRADTPSAEPIVIPMDHRHERFYTQIEATPGTRIHFAFHVTELDGARRIDTWDGNLQEGAFHDVLDLDRYYEMVVDISGTKTVRVHDQVFDYVMANYFFEGVGWFGLLLTLLVALAAPWLLSRLSPRLVPSSYRRRLEDSATQFALPPQFLRAVAWAPVSILVGTVFYLAYGFLNSPMASELQSARFTTGWWNEYVFDEYSIPQILSFTLMIVAGIAGAGFSIRLLRQRRLWPALFYGAFSIVLFVVGMEEVNWFQLVLRYESPSWFQEHGRAGTTSLHNVEGLDVHSADTLQAVFGLGGLLGVWLGTKRRWRAVGAPMALVPWFLIVLGQATLYAINDVAPIWKYYDWMVRQLVEMIEAMIAIAAALYLWLNARMLQRKGTVPRSAS